MTRVLTAFLFAALLIGLTACGGGSSPANDSLENSSGNTGGLTSGDTGATGGSGGTGGSNSSSSVFDTSGNTTSFGIPAGLSGNITAGQQVFQSNCTGCHSSLGARTYTQVSSALASVGAMKSFNLSDQQKADLAAYLNRAAATPAPSPGTGGGGSTGGGGAVGGNPGSGDSSDGTVQPGGDGENDDAGGEVENDTDSGAGGDDGSAEQGEGNGDDSGEAAGD